MRCRKVLAVGFVACSTVLAISGLAWACIVPGTEASLRLAANRVVTGDSVTVHGAGWAAAPVELRWDSATGRVLARPVGPSFSVRVAIPSDAKPGQVHYIVAVQREIGETAAPFQVISPVASPGDASTPTSASNSASAGSAAPATSAAGPSSATTDGGAVQAPSAAGSPTADGAAGSPTADGSTAVPGSAKATSSPLAAPDARSRRAPARPAPASPILAGHDPVEADSSQAGSARPATAPSPRSATGELWSGFSAGRSAPSLVDLPTPGRDPSPLGIVAVGGLVALFGGFAGQELRRRRVAVGASSER